MDSEAEAVDFIKTIINKSLCRETLTSNNIDANAETNVSLNDSSCDNLSDVDLNGVPAKLMQTLKSSHSDTKSVFNINIEEFSADVPSVGDALEIYEEKIKNEQLKWIDFVVNTTKDKQRKVASNNTIKLNDEHYQYLINGPNLHNSVQSSLAFMNEANLFITKIRDMQTIRDNLLQHCQGVVNIRKSQAIANNLSMRNA